MARPPDIHTVIDDFAHGFGHNILPSQSFTDGVPPWLSYTVTDDEGL
jgi:hypothetical protein